MAKSFLERVQPSRQRWKLIDWPFPVEDGEKPKVKLRALGQDESEAAYLAAVDHFKAKKRTISVTDPAFAMREHAETVFRAYTVDGEPLAADVEELTKQPIDVVEELYATYRQFKADVCAVPATDKQMDELVEYLKKSSDTVILSALSSSWLIALITTLASRLPDSTPGNEHG